MFEITMNSLPSALEGSRQSVSLPRVQKDIKTLSWCYSMTAFPDYSLSFHNIH